MLPNVRGIKLRGSSYYSDWICLNYPAPTMSTSALFQPPGPAKRDKPAELSRFFKMLSQVAESSYVRLLLVRHVLATWECLNTVAKRADVAVLTGCTAICVSPKSDRHIAMSLGKVPASEQVQSSHNAGA